MWLYWRPIEVYVMGSTRHLHGPIITKNEKGKKFEKEDLAQ